MAAWALGRVRGRAGGARADPAAGAPGGGCAAGRGLGLGSIEDTRATRPLLTLLRDREAAVRLEAAAALGSIEDPAATTALVEVARRSGCRRPDGGGRGARLHRRPEGRAPAHHPVARFFCGDPAGRGRRARRHRGSRRGTRAHPGSGGQGRRRFAPPRPPRWGVSRTPPPRRRSVGRWRIRAGRCGARPSRPWEAWTSCSERRNRSLPRCAMKPPKSGDSPRARWARSVMPGRCPGWAEPSRIPLSKYAARRPAPSDRSRTPP